MHKSSEIGVSTEVEKKKKNYGIVAAIERDAGHLVSLLPIVSTWKPISNNSW